MIKISYSTHTEWSVSTLGNSRATPKKQARKETQKAAQCNEITSINLDYLKKTVVLEVEIKR